jgi:hypothetical protein
MASYACNHSLSASRSLSRLRQPWHVAAHVRWSTTGASHDARHTSHDAPEARASLFPASLFEAREASGAVTRTYQQLGCVEEKKDARNIDALRCKRDMKT